MTLFELKEKMATLDASINADAEWIAEKAADPATPIDEINAKKSHRDELVTRREMLKAQHDEIEAMERAALEKANAPKDEKTTILKAKAAFYRDAFSGNVKKAYEGLGAIPIGTADLGYGESLLPTTVSNELLVEPEVTNPLRGIVRVTNISGYEEPKLGFTIEDSDIADVTDLQSANEIEMEGDTVVYGRMKMKVAATVKDTVLRGTDTDLVSAIENNLRSALALREKYYAFLPAATAATDTAHAHMSFYQQASGASVIKEVSGATLYAAIVAAYADLNDRYAENARIVMRRADYYSMIAELTNTAESLFSDKPASILGIPVVFCDKATIPVVGDFRYYGINYDTGAIYQVDSDARAGEYYFVFTAWGDQQIRMKSAFRLAVVNP